jgi:hypothetical protein
MTSFRSPDGILWDVRVVLPGSSNAMVIFRHPDGRTARLDRYNWYLSSGPEARSVTSRLSPDAVLAGLGQVDLDRLFSRSMAVSRPAIPSSRTLGL